MLKELVAPHLLRRRKLDVKAQLPKKTEQVLFCGLTPEQLELYRSYLASTEVAEILQGGRQALAGIDILRKICNHPDLLERLAQSAAEDYGAPARSGKLSVTCRLLSHWAQGGHKALLFCQTQQMLDIIEKQVTAMKLTYHRWHLLTEPHLTLQPSAAAAAAQDKPSSDHVGLQVAPPGP